MRLGVLDVGSNTVHLLVVDAHRGAQPTPMTSQKDVLRLAEHIDTSGALTRTGISALVAAVARAAAAAEDARCDELLAFATSAIRDATNADEVLNLVRAETGIDLRVLPGEAEASYTFLAVRRWYGWSAGRLAVIDVGGGSLELAAGRDEQPLVAISLPLGAGRLTRERFTSDPPPRSEVESLAAELETALRPFAERIRQAGEPDLVVGTSKTIRSLARLADAAESSSGSRTPRILTEPALRRLMAFISRMSSTDLAELDGVSPSRAHQLVAGAVVVHAAMRALNVTQLQICPWALREGVILRRLDLLNGVEPTARSDRSAQETPVTLGPLTSYEARCSG